MRPRLIPAAVLLSVLALTGCSASGQSEALLTGEPPMVGQDSVESSAGESADGGAVRAVDSADGEKMIVTGYLTLTVERPAEAASEVALIVETAGGRVDARTEHAPDGEDNGSAELTVRIPSDELTSTLEAIKKLGTVERVEQGKQN